MAITSVQDRATAPFNPNDEAFCDLRFRALVGDDDWLALPSPIRRRFTRRLAGGQTVVYVGEIVETRFSIAGWLLAQAARLIGSPFPLSRDAPAPSVVTVTEDALSGGQIWTRLYARRNDVPQVIHSRKRFSGLTGIEEHVGGGVAMALTIFVRDGALVFRSTRFFIELFGLRVPLPRRASPGTLTVTHAETGGGRFSFTLELVHPRAGLLIHQTAVFRELAP